MRRGPDTIERPGLYPRMADTRTMGELIETYANSARYVSSPTGLRSFRSHQALLSRSADALVPVAQALAYGANPVLSVPFEDIQTALGRESITQGTTTLEQKAVAIGNWAETQGHVAIRNEALRLTTGKDLYVFLYNNALANMSDSDKRALKHPTEYRASFTDWTKRSFIPRIVLPTGREISVLIEKTDLGSKALIFGEQRYIRITDLLAQGERPEFSVSVTRNRFGKAIYKEGATFSATGTVDSSYTARDAILEQGKRLFGIK